MTETELIAFRASEKKDLALKGLPVQHRTYTGSIPDKLLPWYVYIADAGHCLLGIIPRHINIALNDDPAFYLIPLPVKSVMREYKIEDGYINATSNLINYDPVLGLIIPKEDNEY